MRSVELERGLANCPAMRPTFTTGTPIEYVNTTAICRMMRSFSRMLSAENSSKLSAQSPAWSRKALPAATSASEARSERASPANTSGGNPASVFRALCSWSLSGHSGCCLAGRSCHDDGVHATVMPRAYKRRRSRRGPVGRGRRRPRSAGRTPPWSLRRRRAPRRGRRRRPACRSPRARSTNRLVRR